MIVYQDTKLTLDFFETDNILFASWPGYENSDDFKSTMQALSECLQVHTITKLLMDARYYQTTAAAATSWMGELLTKTFPKTKLQKIARLSFPEADLENALQQVIALHKSASEIDFDVATFYNLSDALNWLRS